MRFFDRLRRKRGIPNEKTEDEESILGAKTEVNQNLVRIHGVGYFPPPSGEGNR